MKNQRTILLVTAIIIVQMIAACGGLSGKQKSAAQDAIAALKKIQAATQVGVNYQQYGMLLIEAKDKVNSANTALPDGELKTELNAAMDAYTDASAGWGAHIQNGFFRADSELGQQLIQKYSVKTFGDTKRPLIDQTDMLNKIWAAASPHVDRAVSLLGQ